MKYLNGKAFSSPANSKAYVEGWERVFGDEYPDEEWVYNLCICGGYAYECAYCHERRCMECDERSESEQIKTAVRWCPAHREDGLMGRL